MNSLRSNQIDAVNYFNQNYYEENNQRGILSMCCGSGKTRTFYEILKTCILKKDKVFIYITPRLLLIDAIVKDIMEWLHIENKYIDIFIKASDISLTKLHSETIDKLKKLDKYNSDRYVSYIKKKVKKLISSDDINQNNHILFITTYDSIESLLKIIKKKDIKIDLLVADESHHLSSNNSDLKSAKIIFDEEATEEDYLCKPEKYLFMTATPLQIIKRNKDSGYTDDSIKFSMINENLYGKVFYEYTFYQGIKDKIILDFDVLYLDDLNKEDNENNDLLNNDKKIQDKLYLKLISSLLLKAITQYNLNHTIVFISNQTDAKKFEKMLNDEITNNKILYNVYRLISDDSKTIQNEHKLKFITNNLSILISVSMLDEGVDIPICDSVFFAGERNSETVIVQNIGRALRKNPSKDKAYIIIPGKIYKEENINEDTGFSSNYKKIRDICDILKEPNTNTFFSRKTTLTTIIKTNNTNDTNDTNDIDKIDNTDNDTSSIDDIKEYEPLIKQLVESYEIVSTNNQISNIKFDELKKKVQNANITKVSELNEFFKNNRIVVDKLHIQYKDDWISYSDFLSNYTFNYNEAINFIMKLDLSKIKTIEEWNEYYYSIINNLLDKILIEDNILQDFIKIPSNPSTYYLSEWNDPDENGLIKWEKFLNKKLDNKIIINPICTKEEIKISDNLNNILSIHDKNKYKKILEAGKWQSFKSKLDLNLIEDHMKKTFDINSKLFISFKLNNSLAYDTLYIYVKLGYNNHPEYNNDPEFYTEVAPFIIDSDYKIKYDPKYKDINRLRKYNFDKYNKEKNRTKDKFIHNKEVQNIIKNIKDEIKLFIKNNKSNININLDKDQFDNK